MRLDKVKHIFAKEVLDTLRDRRTLLITIVIPVLLYPGLLIFMNEMAASQQAKMEEKTVAVALIHVPQDSGLIRLMKEEPKIRIVNESNPIDKVRSGEIHFVLEMPPDPEKLLEQNHTALIKLHYDRSNDDATTNLDRVLKVVDVYKAEILKKRLAAKSLTEEYVKPLEVEEVNVASREKMGGFIIGRLLPMLMVLMVLMGSMYPAIDMTAGEKERGTLETILTSPATRAEIVAGKFLTVTLIALLTGLLNLASMTATFSFGIFKQVADTIQIRIPPATLLIMIACLVLIAVFFGGMMMAIASFARSFKEAQNLVMPFYLLATMPAMVSVIPGIQLEGFWLTMPIANITLLFKELMLGVFDWNHVAIVFFVALFLAVAGLFLAVKLFGREEVLFGEAASFGLTLQRSNITAKPVPNSTEAMILCLVAMTLLLYVAIPLQARDMVNGLIVTELLIFLALPIALAFYLKLDFRETFRLRAPSVRSVLLTVLMVIGILLSVGTVMYFQNKIFPIPKQLIDQMEKLLKTAGDVSFPMAFLLIAVLPAVCEETTFRGVVLSGMLDNMKPRYALIITAAMFAAFHLSAHRFLGVFLIGLAASFVVWRSGSIFTGMLLHMLSNGTVAFLVNYPQYDFLGTLELKYSIPQFTAGIALIALSVYLFSYSSSSSSSSA